MSLQSLRGSVSEARLAAWLARHAAHDHLVHFTIIALVVVAGAAEIDAFLAR